LEVLLFSLICLFSVKTVQNSENSQYPNASKRFQIAKTVQNSENSKLVSGTLSQLCYIYRLHRTLKATEMTRHA
jgi:hypothetical protein